MYWQEICAMAGDSHTVWFPFLRKGTKKGGGSPPCRRRVGRSTLRVPPPSLHHRHADWTSYSGPAGIGGFPVCLPIPNSLRRPGQHSLMWGYLILLICVIIVPAVLYAYPGPEPGFRAAGFPQFRTGTTRSTGLH
jgi:hypothetical protein